MSLKQQTEQNKAQTTDIKNKIWFDGRECFSITYKE